MKALVSLSMVLGLAAIGYLVAVAGGQVVIGLVIPVLAVLVFIVGFVARIVKWARSPVPFKIPTTSGQQKSLPWIHQSKYDSPFTPAQTVGRMALEILLFRSLFKNTKAEITKEPRLVYAGDRWLWLFSLVFHWAFLIIFLRHLRFFLEPVPSWVTGLTALDSFFQVGVPVVYATDVLIVVALGFLLLRRFTNPQVRLISQVSDYFPLLLILGVVLSGIVVRYFAKTDVVGVKEIFTGLFAGRFAVPAGIGAQVFVHLFLFSALLVYFPFSKLMHLGGVFLSPTRNLPNDNRAVRHINPWNREVDPRHFEDWEEEFKDEIAQAGYSLERD